MNDMMQNNGINVVAGIFLMKNHFGYRDQQNVVVQHTDPLGAQSDTKELEERYKADIILDPSEVEEKN
jgi:hypothetical protein